MDDDIPSDDELSDDFDSMFVEEPGAATCPTRRVLTGSDRRSLPVLGKLAISKLVSTRAKQLEQNFKPAIAPSLLESHNLERIALQELRERKIPLKIIRRFPNGDVEEWAIEDFKFIAK